MNYRNERGKLSGTKRRERPRARTVAREDLRTRSKKTPHSRGNGTRERERERERVSLQNLSILMLRTVDALSY